MAIDEMTIVDIEARQAELAAELPEATDERSAEISAEADLLNARKAELEAIEERKAQAAALTAGTVEPDKIIETKSEVKKMSKIEERAAQLVESGKMTLETRALLSSGVLTPAAVKEDIGELPEVMSSIVDDVNAVLVDGVGSYSFAYQATDAAAAAVTEGSAISSTAATFATGTISPATWGTLDSISRLVQKKSPLAYEQAVKNAAVTALRRFAKGKIVSTILADSTMTEAKTYTLDKDFVRNVVLGFNADESVAGGTKLYLCKADLATLGAVRGTNEKKAVFEIEFTDENNGRIVDGGLAVNFSICSDLAGKGASSGNAMIYCQPKAITMPLWGNYEIATDEGGKYFDANLIGIRGLQTAGVGITALKAVQLINC